MNKIEFVENKGQWEDNVKFKAKIPGGNLYLEKNEITYQFYNEQDMARFHDLHHHAIKNPIAQDYIMNVHAFKLKFLNSQTNEVRGANPTKDYVNYFLGNDKTKWASNVKKFAKTKYHNIYNKIDLKFYLKEGYLKYDFSVQRGGNPDVIMLDYEGIDKIVLEKGVLKITTSVNEMIEQKPYAYQIIRGKQKQVKCNFKLDGNIVTYEFPKGYNKKHELIIDPTLVFCSYSGSTADNWGYTSTFDDAGHLYGGGVTFGLGYPFTVGAYQFNFAGGNGNYAGGCDITISKFSPNGTSLIYSTYLGGLENESPHSLIVNTSGELLVMGTTASANYPTSIMAYDNSFNGGVLYTGSIPNYVSGADIIISKLSANGTALLASTFVGGSGNDGLNQSFSLQYNYADDYRGEIIVDSNDNIYVASSTLSADFPVTSGVFQPGLSGGQEGCIFKLSPNLDILMWSTFLGGTNDDAAYSLQLNGFGDVLVAGGTASANFPTTLGSLNSGFQGGGVDGWITRINNSATSIIASTFIGTGSYDQTFFVQADSANNVYVVGQTEGTYPIAPATVYNVPNSGQFIHKLSPNLSSTGFSTTVGTGSGEVDIALSAFLVNDCNYIFVSGWGGSVNVANGGAPFSTTNGLPVTASAIQSTTDGSDYYLMMLGEDAATLEFATFFGGNSSTDHVDGGTSRFDKRGIVYQAVCSSCGIANNDFPVTPGAWSVTDNSGNCNLGVFKIDLTTLTAGASVYATPYHCVGDTVDFQNLSNGGIYYYWDFDDGNTSTLFEPSHAFDTAGTYTVMLVSVDSATCLQRDTDYVDIFVNLPPVANVNPFSVCNGDSVQLSVSGGLLYDWQPNYNILNSTTDTPTVFPDTTTIYTVIVTDSCGTDTAQVLVTVFQKNIDIDPDTMICLGQSAQITAYGGTSYLWSQGATLNSNNIANPIATPLQHTTYIVTITDANNCDWDTTITVEVDSILPIALGSANDAICMGDTIEIYASGGISYTWTPNSTLATPNDSSTMAIPSQTTNYVVAVANGCGVDYDTVLVEVHEVIASIASDTIVCAGDQANLWATGGVSYLWYTNLGATLSASNTYSPIILMPTIFYVDVTDTVNCTKTLSVFVDTLVKPYLDIGYDIKTQWGTQVTLLPITNGVTFWWTPSTGLSCTDCSNPLVTASETSTYYLTVKGADGCFNTDTITVFFDGSIYVPNSFSPDGNGVNDFFFAYGKDIVEFEMYIFDRWGEQLFYSDDMEIGWDGFYKGKLCKNDVYVWKVKYTDVLGVNGIMYGTATLLK